MKVILYAAITADGLIAQGPDQNSMEWTSEEDRKFFVSETKKAGVMVMGRTTFDTIGKPLKGRLMYVMTRSPEKFESITGQLEYTSSSPQEIIADAATRGHERLALVGGASLYSLFLEEGLVDELYLTVEPVLFGEGISLLSKPTQVNLELLDSKPLGENAVVLHYNVKK